MTSVASGYHPPAKSLCNDEESPDRAMGLERSLPLLQILASRIPFLAAAQPLLGLVNHKPHCLMTSTDRLGLKVSTPTLPSET